MQMYDFINEEHKKNYEKLLVITETNERSEEALLLFTLSAPHIFHTVKECDFTQRNLIDYIATNFSFGSGDFEILKLAKDLYHRTDESNVCDLLAFTDNNNFELAINLLKFRKFL